VDFAFDKKAVKVFPSEVGELKIFLGMKNSFLAFKSWE
jgi:hypothetical protein